MRISIVTTVLNEGKSIKLLVKSLLKQNISFHRILIVDGGSKDSSLKYISDCILYSQRVEFFSAKGNISYGRNTGVKNSKSEIVTFIDGGCVAKRDWLSEITKPFNNNDVEVVAGFYKMVTTNAFSVAAAPFHGITPRNFNADTYMPSARSLAIRKSTFEKIGGFNEKLYRAGEDTLFNYELLKKNIKFVRAPKAIVYWHAPKTLKEFAKKTFYYALGDAQTGIWWHPTKKLRTHNIKILSIYIRYLFFSSLLFLGVSSNIFLIIFSFIVTLYLLWSIWKVKEDVRPLKSRLLVPFIQIVSDFSVMSGFATGMLMHPKISV